MTLHSAESIVDRAHKLISPPTTDCSENRRLTIDEKLLPEIPSITMAAYENLTSTTMLNYLPMCAGVIAIISLFIIVFILGYLFT